MKKTAMLFLAIIISASCPVVPLRAEDEEAVGCSGTNRIELNDPAELKGGPNDLKRITLEVFRSRNNEGRQVRKLEIMCEIHSRYYAPEPEVVYLGFQLKITNTSGSSGVIEDGQVVPNLPGIAIFRVSDKEAPFSIIESIEEANKIKFTCANVMFYIATVNTETKDAKIVDETEWSGLVDFADTTQPQNPEDFKAENDVGCLRLSWKKPSSMSGSMETQEYRIFKDGKLLASVDRAVMTYKDCDIEAGKTYKYSVCGVSAWKVESPKTPLTVTYTPVAKIIPEKTSLDFGQVELEKLKSQKLKFTNYGDLDAKIKIESSDDWFSVKPSEFVLEKTKRIEVEVAINKEKVAPNQAYEGSIKLTWGTTEFQTVSLSVYIKPDRTPPEFAVDPFTEVTNQLQYTVTGTIEPGATVNVNNINAVVEGDKFKATINILPAPNATNVEIKATDKYGNTIKKNVGKIINILNSKVILVIGSEKMTVNDKEVAIKPAPTIIGGKTLVPLRSVADAFGASISWDNVTKTATIVLRDKTILITLDKDIAFINGEAKPIGSKAIVIGGKTMVPFRFIAEALGAKVDYNGETKTITLTLEIRP